MNTSMDDNGRFRACATAAIEMNPSNGLASIGVPSNYDLRVAGMSSLEIL